MPNILALPSDVRQIISDSMDDLIELNGKVCVLIYPPRWDECANCVYDPIGEKSSNIWITGGPMPFDAGSPCPMCNGAGRKAVEVTENITMVVRNNPSTWWVKPPIGVSIPDGMIQTKGFISDVSKVMQSRMIVVQPNISTIIRWKYELAGEPIDTGKLVQGRYFIALWQRKG